MSRRFSELFSHLQYIQILDVLSFVGRVRASHTFVEVRDQLVQAIFGMNRAEYRRLHQQHPRLPANPGTDPRNAGLIDLPAPVETSTILLLIPLFTAAQAVVDAQTALDAAIVVWRRDGPLRIPGEAAEAATTELMRTTRAYDVAVRRFNALLASIVAYYTVPEDLLAKIKGRDDRDRDDRKGGKDRHGNGGGGILVAGSQRESRHGVRTR